MQAIIWRFAQARRGIAATEFALLAPIMLMAYFGGAQIGDAVAINRKVALAARSVADLTTQYAQVNNSLMSTIISTGSVVVEPYNLASMVIVVSEVTTTDANGDAKVTWSWSSSTGAEALTDGAMIRLPNAGMAPAAGISLILCTATYVFTPNIGYLMTGSFPISDTIYMSPRVSATILNTDQAS